MLSPSREDFNRLSEAGLLVPVTYDLLADVETPVAVYWKLSHDQPHSFLLESVTGGESLARFSMIGIKPEEVILIKGREVTRKRNDQVKQDTLSEGQDALAYLEPLVPKINSEAAKTLPKLNGGAVGVIGYDYVRSLEKLPDHDVDDLQFYDLAMMITRTFVVFDHAKNILRIVCLADPTEAGYQEAKREVEWIRERLRSPMPHLPSLAFPGGEVTSNTEQARFETNVERIKEYIAAGDCIQVVPSLRFSTPCEAHPLTVYRSLRSLNPSPYMYALHFPEFDVVGASPEILVGLYGDTAQVRPIAGTRPRGETELADNTLADELLADEKERAEHVMLVDLGRNDLGRVSEYGSISVRDLMVIERYSHVMHIVSNVEGTLRKGLTAFDLVRATFPAGTVTGAPKVRAMQIINELEPNRRGLYAGAVGYFSATGDVELAIAIRTILLKDGQAFVQAGAGIVSDSNPQAEYQECVNKAKAALQAIQIAQSGLPS